MHPHISVLPNEVLKSFSGKKIKIFIDGTLGLGGHSEAILSDHPEIEILIGIDQDENALNYARNRLEKWKSKLRLVKGNFSEIRQIVKDSQIEKADGVLLDIGVSSIQLDVGERGFSFTKEGPLDMRMDASKVLTAEEIVNQWPEKELALLIRNFGEEPQWKRAARMIVEARRAGPLKTTKQLADVLEPLVPHYKRRIHPATLVFQALRIAVNDELDALSKALPAAMEIMAIGGILAVISFHSLEDRIVKEFFKDAASDKVSTSGIGGVFLDKEPTVRLLTRKPVVPAPEEQERNPRSRSAKLRAAEKLR